MTEAPSSSSMAVACRAWPECVEWALKEQITPSARAATIRPSGQSNKGGASRIICSNSRAKESSSDRLDGELRSSAECSSCDPAGITDSRSTRVRYIHWFSDAGLRSTSDQPAEAARSKTSARAGLPRSASISKTFRPERAMLIAKLTLRVVLVSAAVGAVTTIRRGVLPCPKSTAVRMLRY